MKEAKKSGKTDVLRISAKDKEFIENMVKRRNITMAQCFTEIVDYYRTGQVNMQEILNEFLKISAKKEAESMALLETIFYNTAPQPEQFSYIIGKLKAYWRKKFAVAGIPIDAATEDNLDGKIQSAAVKIGRDDLKKWQTRMQKEIDEYVKSKKESILINVKIKQLQEYVILKHKALEASICTKERLGEYRNQLRNSAALNAEYDQIIEEIDAIATKIIAEEREKLDGEQRQMVRDVSHRFHEKVHELYRSNNLGEVPYDQKTKWTGIIYEAEDPDKKAVELYNQIKNSLEGK